MRVIAYICILVLVVWLAGSCNSQPPSVTVNGQQLTPIKLDKDGRFIIPNTQGKISWDKLANELLNIGYVWPKDAEEVIFQTSWSGGGKLFTCLIDDNWDGSQQSFVGVYHGEVGEKSFVSDSSVYSTLVYTFETLSSQWEWIIFDLLVEIPMYDDPPLEESQLKCRGFKTLEEAQREGGTLFKTLKKKMADEPVDWSEVLELYEIFFLTLEEMADEFADWPGRVWVNMPEALGGMTLLLKPPTGDYVFLILLFDEQDVQDAL